MLIPLLATGLSLGWLLLLPFWVSHVHTPRGSLWRVGTFSLLAVLTVGLAYTDSELQARRRRDELVLAAAPLRR